MNLMRVLWPRGAMGLMETSSAINVFVTIKQSVSQLSITRSHQDCVRNGYVWDLKKYQCVYYVWTLPNTYVSGTRPGFVPDVCGSVLQWWLVAMCILSYIPETWLLHFSQQAHWWWPPRTFRCRQQLPRTLHPRGWRPRSPPAHRSGSPESPAASPPGSSVHRGRRIWESIVLFTPVFTSIEP